MTKNKTTKRALLASAVSLILCFSMLLGTTYAWFTDSVTSTNNKIVAGNLEVDLLMADADGEYKSIADEDAAIFGADSLVAQDDISDTLWEPGKTQIAYLGVENKGTLDLKYNILLNVIDGGLIGSLEYAIIDGFQYGAINTDGTDWAALKAAANAQTGDVKAGSTVAAPNGAIQAAEGEERAIDYFALAIHMKEDAGNEYQGKDITVDLTVLATQLASEEDSFNSQYDAMSTYLNKDTDGNWLIASAGDLAYFAYTVNNGNKYDNETVKLIADIDLAKYNWIPIGTDANYFSGNFDGQGYTVSNLYINAPTMEYVGLFGAVKYGASLKSVTLNNVNVTGQKLVGGLVGLAYSGVTIDNCHATGNVSVVGNYKVGGLVGGDYFTMTNCSVGVAATTFALAPAPTAHIKGVHLKKDLEGDNVGGVVGFAAEDTRMENNSAIAVVEGTRKVGGVYGYVGYGATVKGSSFSGSVSTNASAEYVAENEGKISVGGVIGEIGTVNDSGAARPLTLESLTIADVTLNGLEAAFTGAIIGKDRHGNQVNPTVAELNGRANVTINLATYVYDAAELTEALKPENIDKDAHIIFGADITGNFTVVAQENIAVTVDGNNKILNGTITVDGRTSTILSSATTIKNVKFIADAVSTEACVNMGVKGNANTRYICNLTVENCYFNVPTAVAVKSYDNGDHNLKIVGCTVAEGMHSVLQVNNVAGGLLVEDCKIYSKNGINTVQSGEVTVRNCEIDTIGYCVRFGASSGGTGVAETYRIEGCTLKTQNDDGDAAVVLRGTADYSTLTIVDTTIDGNPDITNTAVGATVNK